MKLLETVYYFARQVFCHEHPEGLRPFIKKLPEKYRLARIPRYTPTQTDILGNPLTLIDAASFLYIYEEVFERQIYKFKTKNRAPKIIDGGANIGLSAIYFKQLYPESSVIAFEPDDMAFEALRKNLASFGYNDVECLQKALWNSDTSLQFLHEGADGGRIALPEDKGTLVTIAATRLRPYLTEPVDLLKLDVEGAETDVLKDCSDLLHNVEYLFVEYHSFANKPQSLNTIIDIMDKAGFRLHIHPPLTSPQPFCRRNIYFGMDMQLNIFGFRDR